MKTRSHAQQRHALVGRLRAQGIVALAATAPRDIDDNRHGSRSSRFIFVRFRVYVRARVGLEAIPLLFRCYAN